MGIYMGSCVQGPHLSSSPTTFGRTGITAPEVRERKAQSG